ncbi:YggT family protein [Phenylobacterium sp.]|uniref:YggT family protein n=1 Tax=Phenylobacterium sp. TaxID=1871053 RepID=UPI0025CF8E14|nr:YggT family protein [Phenylobacterium sp.]MBX3483720.1 YggT family protein [Phenylobacterium sp.]MCW5761274.1 YggT family protein [Phenylobacterium sp.]
MGTFIYFVLDGILFLMIAAIIVSAILSWLVAFNVINLRNQFVYSVVHFLDAVTRPILRPFQRIIPPLGGVDISPIFAILILQGIKGYLLPWLFRFLPPGLG